MITKKCVSKYLDQVACGEPTPQKIRDYALLCIARDNLENEHVGHQDRRNQKMDKHMAEEWTEQMKNADGTTGPHWPMEKIKPLMDQKPELQRFDFAEVYAVINMMYSDYCEVAKKFNANDIDFYVCMTKAWLNDKDAGAGKSKTATYYEYIVK